MLDFCLNHGKIIKRHQKLYALRKVFAQRAQADYQRQQGVENLDNWASPRAKSAKFGHPVDRREWERIAALVGRDKRAIL